MANNSPTIEDQMLLPEVKSKLPEEMQMPKIPGKENNQVKLCLTLFFIIFI